MRRYTISAVSYLLLATAAYAAELKLTVEEPTGVLRTGWPVTSGIPIDQGAMTDEDAANAVLFADADEEVPLQTEVLARWPDGSVRWLLLDFQVDLAPKEKKTFALRHGSDVRRRKVEQPIRMTEDDAHVVIDTGPMRCELSSERFRLLDAVWLDADRNGEFSDDERVTRAENAGIVLTTPSGKTFRADLADAELVVEQTGPLRACVRVAGKHASDDGTMFRYVVRIHAFRDQPFVRCFYTFVNDYPDALMAKIESLDLVFAGSPAATGHPVLNRQEGETGRLLQVDENHYQRNGEAAGERAAGWAAASGAGAGFAVGLREFWQNWPKAIETRDDRIVLGISPDFPPGLYDGKPLLQESKLYYSLRDGVHTFKCGAARTHEFWAIFFAGTNVDDLASFFRAAEAPLLATCDPAYAGMPEAAGKFPPADPEKYAGYDAWLDRALESHLKRRDQVREYGMLNYGDWYGERSVNWGNLEYDLAHGLFLQYLRSGDRRYFLRAEQAARHHIDVDVAHATNEHLRNPWGGPPRVGDIWLHCVAHTGGYYSGAPLPVDRTYQMGHSTNFGHVWVSGDFDYYYLTGDRRAREVAVKIADAMVSHMPTRYGTHIRALGWPMILVLEAYQATGDPKYLEAATANWQVLKKEIDWERGWVVRLAKGHCLHKDRQCHGNVPFMEGLTLCALTRYHRVTNDPDVLRAITVGIDQMIRECWQKDAKTFSYTACPLSSRTPHVLFMLSVEAMAYEVNLTGNKEHLRILREGLRAAIPSGGGNELGKNLAQMIFFTPHGLAALEKE